MKNRVVRIHHLLIVIVIFAAFVASCASQKTAAPTIPAAQPTSDKPYCSIDYRYPLDAASQPKIYVYKNQRKLLLVNDNVLIRDYRIALGPNPNGDKYFQGDGRTPEGNYSICVKNPVSKYYKSLGLNFPDPKHAQIALEMGFISPEEYSRIVDASNGMKLPPYNTALGGAIFIHGGGGAREDWTLGCIALNNTDIDELFQVVRVGTPVLVLP